MKISKTAVITAIFFLSQVIQSYKIGIVAAQFSNEMENYYIILGDQTLSQ